MDMKLPADYKLRKDGTYSKAITYGWGFDKKVQQTETIVRSAKGAFLSVEGRAKRKPSPYPTERLPYRKRL